MALMWRIETVFQGISGAPYYNQLYWEHTAVPAVSSAVLAVAQFWGDLEGLITDDLTYNVDGEVPIIESSTGATVGVDTTSGFAGAGTNIAETLPRATQGLARLRTGTFINGRELRGRIFIPGACESNSDGGKPSASYISTVNSEVAALASAGLQVFSPTHLQVAFVTGGTCWNDWAVLRSRRD